MTFGRQTYTDLGIAELPAVKTLEVTEHLLVGVLVLQESMETPQRSTSPNPMPCMSSVNDRTTASDDTCRQAGNRLRVLVAVSIP